MLVPLLLYFTSVALFKTQAEQGVSLQVWEIVTFSPANGTRVLRK